MAEQVDSNQSHIDIKDNENLTIVANNMAGRDVNITQQAKTPRPCPPPPAFPLAFGGRDSELKTILKQLQNGKNVAITALTGGGGIGKTTLAEAIAHTVIEQKLFRTVLWVEVNQAPDLFNSSTIGGNWQMKILRLRTWIVRG